jgi:hypothetical protein
MDFYIEARAPPRLTGGRSDRPTGNDVELLVCDESRVTGQERADQADRERELVRVRLSECGECACPGRLEARESDCGRGVGAWERPPFAHPAGYVRSRPLGK